MRKISAKSKMRALSKAKERLSKETVLYLAISAFLLMIIVSEQLRLTLLN